MNQSPSLLLFYVSRNHHFSIIHTFCKVPSLVGSPLSSISLIMMKLLLLHKSNPFLCPPRRPLLPGRAQPTPPSFPLTHLELSPLIFPQPLLQSFSHSHHNQAPAPRGVSVLETLAQRSKTLAQHGKTPTHFTISVESAI